MARLRILLTGSRRPTALTDTKLQNRHQRAHGARTRDESATQEV
jgi:hypothetical protein